MITLKTKRQIKDSTVNRNRHRNEIFTVTPERLKEIQSLVKFETYFEIVKIERKIIEPVAEKKTRGRKKKDE